MKFLRTVPFDPGATGVLGYGSFSRIRSALWAAFLFALTLAFFYGSVFGASWLALHGILAYAPAILLPIVACEAYALLVRRFEKREPTELKNASEGVPQLMLGFLLGGVFIAGMWLMLYAFNLYTAHQGAWSRWFDDLVFDSYISAVLEELAFRSILLRIFSRLWGERNGLLLSSLLFGLAHLTHHSWLGVLGIILNGGLTMGLLYLITGRLWMSIGMHLGYDFIETSLLGIGSDHGFLVSQPRAGAAAWLTGGTFGPDAAIPAMVLGLLLNVYLWRLAFPREGLHLFRQSPRSAETHS